jgi:predicted dehydrogenase
MEIMRYFMGDIEAVHCFAMKSRGRTMWSTASINIKFACGAVGHLTSSYDIARGHPMERCEVAGLKGRLVFEDMWREAALYPAGNPEKRVYTNPVFGGYEGFDDTFRDRIRSFARQVDRGDKPRDIDGSGAQGLAAQTAIHAAIESLKTGRVVYLNEVEED